MLDRCLSVQDLMSNVSEHLDLDDFGPLDFIPAFEQLTDSLNKDARLNVLGKLATRTYLLQILTYRLKLQADRNKHPEIENQKIRGPVFITGLPRTGSTLLFELMALNSTFQSPRTWEIMYPLFARDGKIVRRLNQTRSMLSVGLVQLMAPEYRKIHEIGTFLPQECIAIQSLALQSIQFHTTYDVSSYQAWLENSDWTPAYRIHLEFLQHLQFLQFLQHSKGEYNWLLKAPGHLYSLDKVFDTYPDALVIHTHRNPLEVIPSITSLSVTLRQAFSDSINETETGRFSAMSWHQALTRSLDWRDKHPEKEGQILDVDYRDFISDQQGTIENIYKFLGLEWAPSLASGVKDYLARKPQHRHGSHTYTLDEYGLSKEEEFSRYQNYINRFNL